jgi:ubiquinone/menaquinone biosynthesis C-methylase UbiE
LEVEGGRWKVKSAEWPGPADVAYFTQAQASGWGETLRGFVKFLALATVVRALDVGTGPGLLPRLLADAGARQVVGCDESRAMLKQAQALTPRGGAEPAWAAADALRLPFADGAFDAALATNLLFLLPDPGAGIAALARVTRPGGTVACVNPTENMSRIAAEAFAAQRGLDAFGRFSFANYGRLAEEHQRLSPAQWSALAESAGLTGVKVETRAAGLVVFLRGEKRIGG